jgi:flagellum-specific peptidoglycan hydrolase FlgJ
MHTLRHNRHSSKAHEAAFAFLVPVFFAMALLLPSVSPARAQTPPPAPAGTPVPAPANKADSTESFTPKLSIPIPDVSLTKYTTRTDGTAKYIDIPWLAQYVSGVYKYATGFAGLLATVMAMVGGFQYLTAGGDSARVSAGKKRITDALVGMLLVLGTYLILNSVNPDLVKPPVISVFLVEKKVFEHFPGPENAANMSSSMGPIPNMDESDKEPQDLTIPKAADCKNKAVTQEMRDSATRLQEKTGVPAALTLAQFGVESSFGKNCIGKYNCFGIKCSSGGKYAGMDTHGGEGVTPPNCPENCIRAETKEDLHNSKGPVPFYSCFQRFNNMDEAFEAHNRVVTRKNWKDYAKNPVGSAKYVKSWGYATAENYVPVLLQVMKDHCLLSPLNTHTK